MICSEIDETEVTASDFTVEIRNLPEDQLGHQAEFKNNLWKWIEDLCE
jgi:hypothetical protein